MIIAMAIAMEAAMRINLKFDNEQAEWLVEVPAGSGFILPTEPNAPLSHVVNTIRAARPEMDIDIDLASMFAYHCHKWMCS